MATTVTKHVGYPEQGLFMPAFLVELQLLGIVPSLSYGLIGSCSFEGWLVLKEPFQNSVWATTVCFPHKWKCVCVYTKPKKNGHSCLESRLYLRITHVNVRIP